MFRALRHTLVTLLFALAIAPAARASAPANGVFVVGALHGLHASESAFGYAELTDLLDAIQPDILVLEVRPDELEQRAATPGRPEYPAVVWPWLAGRDVQTVAMEPGGETFAKITGAAGGGIRRFQGEQPEEAIYWDRLQTSFETALARYWTDLAETQDQVTADLARAYAIAEARLIGPDFTTAQAEWDGYMVDVARRTVAANPGKRILVLGSYRNRAGIEAGLTSIAGARLVDTEAWMRERAQAGSTAGTP